MVFFVCEGCNESLKKNQVDKHALKCHGCWAVTCVDCSVTFPGNEYAAHTSCVSEAQKYEGSLYKGKKEKMSAQDKWALVLEYALEHMSEAPATIRSYVPGVCQSANVPRQQKKFINFAKNSVRLHSPPLLEELWGFLESCRVKCLPDPVPEQTPAAATTAAATDAITAAGASASATTVAAAVTKEEDEHADKKEKTSKKKKKKKEKEEKGSEPDSNATDKGAVEANSVLRKEKKKSKKKCKEVEAVQVAAVVQVAAEVQVAESTESKKEKKEKKAKKKRKLEHDSSAERDVKKVK